MSRDLYQILLQSFDLKLRVQPKLKMHNGRFLHCTLRNNSTAVKHAERHEWNLIDDGEMYTRFRSESVKERACGVV